MAENDENNRSNWIIRMYYFSYYSACGSIEPYISLYYHSALNLNGEVVGWLGAIHSFTTFLAAPLWGILTDKIGNPFGVVNVNFCLSLLGYIFLMSYSGDRLWVLSLCTCLISIVQAPIRPLFDSMVLSNITDRSSYGRSRLFGTLGFGVGTSLVGLLRRRGDDVATSTLMKTQDQVSPWLLYNRTKLLLSNIKDDQLPFMVHLLLSIPAFLAIVAFQRMHVQNQKQQKQTTISSDQREKVATKSLEDTSEETNDDKSPQRTQIRMFLGRNDVLAFFAVTLVLGASTGAIEAFCSLSMQEVGISKKTIGLFRLISSSASIPMYWFSGNIKTKLGGTENILILSLVLLAVRFSLYALMSSVSPFWCAFISEGLRGVVVGLFRSTSAVHASNLAPSELHSTVSMLHGAIYQGLGRSMGSIIAGRMQSSIGTSSTFLYFAGLDAFFAVFVAILYATLLRESKENKSKQD